MVKQVNRGNRVVWQDIKPVKKQAVPQRKPVTLLKKKLSNPLLILKKIPDYKKYLDYFKKLPRKTQLTSLIIFIVTLVFVGGLALISNNGKLDTKTLSSTQAAGLVSGTPSYPVLVPSGKSVQDLGGYIRTDKRPLFVYVDDIGNVKINVSQQPLPESFKSNPADQVEQLAKAYKASGKITVGDMVVHIGTSAKGPQSVIFTKNNLLVLIVSSDKIDNDQWAKYINSMQ